MSKFLNLCEEYDPENTGNPKEELFDFLKSKNVPVIMSKDSIMVTVGSKKIMITVVQEEENQSINQGLTDIRSAGGKDASKANQLLNQQELTNKKTLAIAPKFIKKRSDDLKETEKLLNKPKPQIIK